MGERFRKKTRSRTESSVKEYHSSLSTNNTFTSSRWERLRERINTPRKKPHSKHLKFDKHVVTISRGYLSDNAVKCSLKEKEKVHIMDSVAAKYFHSEGFLTAEIAVLRDQANVEDVFVILLGVSDVLVFHRSTQEVQLQWPLIT